MGRFRVLTILDSYSDPFLNNGSGFNSEPVLLVPDLELGSTRGPESSSKTGSTVFLFFIFYISF